MQRLILIGFWLLDPISADLSTIKCSHRRPSGKNNLLSSITLLNSIHDNTNTELIVNILKRQSVRFHLLIDAIEMFWPACDSGFNPMRLQQLINWGDDFIDNILLALFLLDIEPLGQIFLIYARLKESEGHIF